MKILSLSLPSLKYITLVILVTGFLLGTFLTPLHKVQAQVTDTASLQAQIQMLMKIVLQLTAQLANQNIFNNEISSEGGFSVKDFKDGDEIKTISNLKVRLSPSLNGQLVQIIPKGSMGQILTSPNGSYSNPTEANGYTWWRVRYESLGITGWSVENWLQKVNSSNINNSEKIKIGNTDDVTDSVSLTSITNARNPYVTGIYDGDGVIGFSIASQSGDKVYGSGSVKVKNGKWSHKIATDLDTGTYSLVLYVDNRKRIQTSFTVNTGVAEASKSNPYIRLIEPSTYNVTYDKSDPTSDVVSIKWKNGGFSQKQPYDIEIRVESTSIESGSTYIGGTWLKEATDATGFFKIDISKLGSLDPGKYKVRLTVKDCNPRGCDYSDGSERVYTRSQYGYFTIIDSKSDSSGKAPSCTISTSNPTPKVGEPFTVSWTSKNIPPSQTVFYEGTKAGGSYLADWAGSLTFNEPTAYTATFGLRTSLGASPNLCSVSVDVVDSTQPSCTLKTDKTTYEYQDQIKVSWTSDNANYAVFVPDTSGKDNLYISPEKDLANSYTYVDATVLGYPTLRLKVVGSDGSAGYCATTFKVKDKLRTFEVLLNNANIKSIPLTTKNEAISLCTDTYNGYSLYNTYSYLDTLQCLWDGTVFRTEQLWSKG